VVINYAHWIHTRGVTFRSLGAKKAFQLAALLHTISTLLAVPNVNFNITTLEVVVFSKQPLFGTRTFIPVITEGRLLTQSYANSIEFTASQMIPLKISFNTVFIVTVWSTKWPSPLSFSTNISCFPVCVTPPAVEISSIHYHELPCKSFLWSIFRASRAFLAAKPCTARHNLLQYNFQSCTVLSHEVSIFVYIFMASMHHESEYRRVTTNNYNSLNGLHTLRITVTAHGSTETTTLLLMHVADIT
jgi:hypothetical protein